MWSAAGQRLAALNILNVFLFVFLPRVKPVEHGSLPISILSNKSNHIQVRVQP